MHIRSITHATLAWCAVFVASTVVTPNPAIAATPASSSQPVPQVGPHGKQLYYFMVFSNATPGADEEFNRWYDQIHAPVMIESGDFIWAQRFELSPVQFGGGTVSPGFPIRQYMVIFAIETDDIKKTVEDANRRMLLPRNISSKAIDYSSLLGVSYQALGPQTSQQEAQRMLAIETAAGRLPSPDAKGPSNQPPVLPPPPNK